MMKIISLNEIVWIYLLPISLASIIGYIEVATMLIGGIIFFYMANKVIWGGSAPKT